MALKIVQAGSGETRDVALLFLTGSEAAGIAAALGASVCVIAETDGTFGPGATVPWNDCIDFAREQVGDFRVGKLWLIGFSAGCQGVRWQLALGAPADHVIAADGIHLPLGNPSELQTKPWVDMATRARAGQATFAVSYSMTGATEFRTTRDSAKILFGTPVCTGSYEAPCVQRKGRFAVYGATLLPAQDAASEHMNQLRVLLYRMIADAKKGSGWGNLVLGAVALVAGYLADKLL